MVFLLFILGLIFLIIGAEVLVRGASSLATVFGISPLVIGLTVVAFGTSSPELAVSIKSAMSGQPGVAVGNVVGSNIFNVLFVLGLSALIVPLVVSKQLVRFDVPFMIILSVIIFILALDENFSRINGLVLFLGLVLYLWFLIYQSRRENVVEREGSAKENGFVKSIWIKNIGMVIGGLLLLVLGSRWLVDSAVLFAKYLGVSELVVGLTIVAVGTSLPEVVTSIIAAIRGERDIAVGNVVGSNIFNLMGVLGVASMVSPIGIEVPIAVIELDIPVMIGVALLCLPMFYTGSIISRKEGVLLLAYYVLYTTYLILNASNHEALPRYSAVVIYFVIPLTVVTLIVLALRERRCRRK